MSSSQRLKQIFEGVPPEDVYKDEKSDQYISDRELYESDLVSFAKENIEKESLEKKEVLSIVFIGCILIVIYSTICYFGVLK